MLRVVWLLGLLICLLGCSSGGGTTASTGTVPDVKTNNGRWVSNTSQISTEWTFHDNGSYDALHHEGTVVAQIHGTFTQEGNHLTVKPDRDAVDARSGSKPEEAAEIKSRLEKGYHFTLNPKEGGFIGVPDDGTSTMTFKPM